MSIETSTITSASAPKVGDSSTAKASSATSTSENSKSFKDELNSAKAQETKTADETKSAEKAQNANLTKSTEDIKAAETIQKQQQTQTEEAAKNQLSNKNQVLGKEKKFSEEAEKNVINPIEELTSQITSLNTLKKGSISTFKEISTKTEETNDNLAYCQTIKMDNQDVNFFLNLVENQQNAANNLTGLNLNATNNFPEIKSEATQKTVQVSQALLDSLNEASKTGKPLRIDFDSNIAVIMKVDKNGTISANFIPGDAAVENYLRNNIASLRQSFDDQNLPYNELSYSKQQHQEQKRKNNKENDDE